jgi:phage-related protein
VFFRTDSGNEPVREWLLLHAFIKKTQTTPKRDLDLALQRKKQLR